MAAARLHDFSVYLRHGNPRGTEPDPSELCAKVNGALGLRETRRIVCTNGLSGRYVDIVMPGDSEVLTLCEVEVQGVPGKAIMGQQRAGLLIIILLFKIIRCPMPKERFVLFEREVRRAGGRARGRAGGHMGAWARGRVGAWARGRVGAWARGRVGAWARGLGPT